MQLYLNPEFAQAWKGKDPFAQVEQLQGQIFRQIQGRRTVRFELNGRFWFLKYHAGAGWKEIIKNLVQLRLPILGASNEKKAVDCLQAAGVGTMAVAAFGVQGANPARQQSFIITAAVEPSLSLEQLCAGWRVNRPEVNFKRALLHKVAAMVRAMHAAGLTHRDFYLCHFLLRTADEQQPIAKTTAPELAIIDLHRALIYQQLPRRWRVKDLASLYFSAFDIGLTRGDRMRFIKYYRQESLRKIFAEEAGLWREVQRRSDSLYAKAIRKGIVAT